MRKIVSLEDVTESRLCWPDDQPRTAYRGDSAFKGRELDRETRLIEDELGRWGVKHYIISRNNARIFAGDPGIAVWWTDPSDKTLHRMACDKWRKLADNARAIYKTLDHLRAIERYGAYKKEQAAEGTKLKQLPAPDVAWWQVIAVDRDWPLPAIEGMYRNAMKSADDAQQRALNAAIETARAEKADAANGRS